MVSLVAHPHLRSLRGSPAGLDAQLAQFPRPPGAYEDALCFCDITTGPGGTRVSAPERLAEIETRYGPGHVVTRFVDLAREEILACVVRHLGRGARLTTRPCLTDSPPPADRLRGSLVAREVGPQVWDVVTIEPVSTESALTPRRRRSAPGQTP